MDKTRFGRVGFGCWQIGGENFVNGRHNGWGDMSEKQALSLLGKALDNGINFFDTADAYGQGVSEERLGKAINSRPDVNAYICTKCGNRVDTQGRTYQDFSSAWIRQAVEASLRRLNVACIDVLLMHSPPDDYQWTDEQRACLDTLVSEGKIAAYGVSAKTVYGAAHHFRSFGTAIEAVYNAVDRRAGELVFNDATATDLTIARVPLFSGFLSAKGLQDRLHFPENDLRSQLAADDVSWRSAAVEALRFLDDLEGGIGVSALRFCLSNNKVDVVIPGIKKIEHIDAAILAHRLGPLPQDVLESIERLAIPLPKAWCRDSVRKPAE